MPSPIRTFLLLPPSGSVLIRPDAVVVGDSVWDLLAARRARALGVGLLSGGYGREELERAGAYRFYDDSADLLRHLDEVGVRARPHRRGSKTERSADCYG
jgi:hypothetical protein